MNGRSWGWPSRYNEGMANRWVVVAGLGLAGCGGGSEADPDVVIIRGDPASEWLDLTIEGAELDAPQGTAVILQIGMPDRPPERLGRAVTEVHDGVFPVVVFPDVWELGLYKRKVVLLDLDGDGACGDGDTVLVDFSASVVDVAMTTADFFPSDCTELVADWPDE
jgi:hypothetical protein